MSSKPIRIVADCDIPFLKGVLEPYAQVRYIKGDAIGNHDLIDADALIVRTRTRCDSALLDATQVKLIATATIGFDHIDTRYCQAHGIAFETAQGCNARGVLQYIMAALARLAALDGWTPSQKTLGVVGVGNVGSLIAQYGELFGFHVLRCDPPKALIDPQGHYVPLEQLLTEADVVTCHVPLERGGAYPTLQMAAAAFFNAMRRGSVFINSSRGQVIDDQALLDALRGGHLSHAVVDTWNNEPHIHPELLQRATFTTSHIAGYSIQGKAAGTAAVVRAIGRHFGLPLCDWYPQEVQPSRPDLTIGWQQMAQAMPRYFDIEAETAQLKSHPERFEQIRNHYAYRTEFF